MYVYVYTVDIIRNTHTHKHLHVNISKFDNSRGSLHHLQVLYRRASALREALQMVENVMGKIVLVPQKKGAKKASNWMFNHQNAVFFGSKSRALSFKPWGFFIMENMESFQQPGGIQLIHAGQFGTQKNGGWRCIK